MIIINFYPESDKTEYIEAANEYTEIWNKEGHKIFDEIERISGLKFKTKIINAVTFKGHSHSLPLRLDCSYSYTHKKASLIHELCHRLTLDNGFYIFDYKNLNEDIHKITDLILYDIWITILGEKAAEESREVEIKYGDPVYKSAWDWALALTYEERQSKFKELTQKYSNYKKPKKNL